jgi:hypothetical protein
MRKAAVKAKIIESESSERLQLALEPEAACVACELENASLKKCDAFMVLDCGGGTVDITMHRVLAKQPRLELEELAPPSGGPYGSTFVDREFENLLKDLVGEAAFDHFKPSGDWIELMRTWEEAKTAFNPTADGGLETYTLINLGPILDSEVGCRTVTPIPRCCSLSYHRRCTTNTTTSTTSTTSHQK